MIVIVIVIVVSGKRDAGCIFPRNEQKTRKVKVVVVVHASQVPVVVIIGRIPHPGGAKR